MKVLTLSERNMKTSILDIRCYTDHDTLHKKLKNQRYEPNPIIQLKNYKRGHSKKWIFKPIGRKFNKLKM